MLSKSSYISGKAWARSSTSGRGPRGPPPLASALNRTTSTVFAGMLTIGGISYYLAQAKKEKRLENCEYLPEDDNYKASNIRYHILVCFSFADLQVIIWKEMKL